MIALDDVTKGNIKEHHSNWPQILDILYRLWIWKTNSLFDIISQQPDIDKIYLYAKDPYEAIYSFLIKKQESTILKHSNDSKAFIE